MEELAVEKKQALHKGNYLEKELVRMNKMTEEKLQEMDKLFKENDRYKEDLSRITLTYDLDTFDRNQKCIEAYW